MFTPVFNKAFSNTIFNIKLNGTNKKAFIKSYTEALTKDSDLQHIDFYSFSENEKIKIRIPVRTTGLAEGVTLGGVLDLVSTQITVRCLPDKIPEFIELDSSIIAVGDVCSTELLASGFRPWIIIHDNQTKRSSSEGKSDDRWAHLNDFGEKSIKIRNPSGAITRALWKAIQDALQNAATTRITVQGEEDLATLPCILMAPIGTIIVYGQPDRGMVLVVVTEEEKSKSMAILEAMTEE